MQNPLRPLFVLTLALSATPALALELNSEPDLESFQAEISQHLPEKLRNAIDTTVTIRFEALDEAQDLAKTVCPGANENRPSPKLGTFRAKREGLFWGKRSYELVLSENLREAVLAGPEAAAKIPCGHGDLYRLALATAIHETAHIYDLLNLPQEPGEAEARAQCMNLTSQEDRQSAQYQQLKCDYYQSLTKTVSDRLPYRHLTGWSVSTSQNKNRLGLRSPDPYEFANTTESFAVNMEHFLMDPEFQCRRPALYDFLAEHFGVRPHEGACEMNWKTRMSQSLRPIDLDPSRIYEVHYLLAGKGEAMMSRWGHSMLRLVVCSPKRKEVGPDCLRDISHHVVISYRANINGITIDNIAGLTGKYPSQLFFQPMPEIIGEYSMGENRDIISLPLKLSEAEKRRLIALALELNWSYQGKYLFLSNNCATETVHFLQAVIDDMDFKRYYAMFDTPVDFYADLIRFGLVDPKLTDAPGARDRYFFPGFYRLVNQSLDTLRKMRGFPDLSVEEIIGGNFGPEKRRELFEKLKELNPGEGKRIAVQFLYIEMRSRERVREDLKKHLGKLLADARERPESMDAQLLAALEEVAEISYSLSPWNRAKPGYGIPFAEEAVRDEELVPVADKLTELKNKAVYLSQDLSAVLFEEFKQISRNIELFVKETK